MKRFITILIFVGLCFGGCGARKRSLEIKDDYWRYETGGAKIEKTEGSLKIEHDPNK